jgi:hypothetical protein
MARNPIYVSSLPTRPIPRFTGEYEIETIDEIVVNLRFKKATEFPYDGYLLKSIKPIAGLGNQHSYSFRCVGRCNAVGVASQTLRGLFHVPGDASVQIDEGTGDVIIPLAKAVDPSIPVFTIRVIITSNMMMISLLPDKVIVGGGDLDLPPPVTVLPTPSTAATPTSTTTLAPPAESAEVTAAASEQEEEDVCVICLQAPTTGQEIQHLGSCRHIFHSECINKWLSRGHRDCPLCKQLVPVKPGTHLKRSPDSVWSEDGTNEDFILSLFSAQIRH